MKAISNFMRWTKDGGPDSPVDAFWIIEMKGLFSIAILRFNAGMRETYHNHAFNAWTWFICGEMQEERIDSSDDWSFFRTKIYRRSIFPKVTRRENTHRVRAFLKSWCITIRGPWAKTWHEVSDDLQVKTILSDGRKVVKRGRCDDYCGGYLFGVENKKDV